MKNSEVIIKRVESVAAYLNFEDDIVIRQISSMGDADAVVTIPHEYIQILVDRLLALKEEAGNA